jgi:tripartite-type tricarboxylate transporter receptor subunit TctC
MLDVIAGNTKVMFSSLIQTTPQVKAGKLRALATGGLKRNPVLPDVPTVAESGVPGYEANNWWGMVAPAGTPPEIVDKLNKAVSAALDAPELQEQFAREGAEAVKMTPPEFGKYMETEMEKWGRVVKEAGITAQ